LKVFKKSLRSAHNISAKLKKKAKEKDQELQMKIILFIIVIIFLVCHTPKNVVNILEDKHRLMVGYLNTNYFPILSLHKKSSTTAELKATNANLTTNLDDAIETPIPYLVTVSHLLLSFNSSINILIYLLKVNQYVASF
jgi:hypothetical protein